MYNEELHNLTKDKKISIKNDVFINNQIIEKYSKYDLSKIIIGVGTALLILIIINLINNFIGIFFILLLLTMVIFVAVIGLNIYIKAKLNKAKADIKKLERQYLEIEKNT